MNSTKVNEIPTPERKFSPQYVKSLEDYVKADLRKRFDDSDFTSAINIMDSTRDFGFMDLFNEMKNDYCQDQDAAIIFRMHENFRNREMLEGQEPTERQFKSFVHSGNGVEL